MGLVELDGIAGRLLPPNDTFYRTRQANHSTARERNFGREPYGFLVLIALFHEPAVADGDPCRTIFPQHVGGCRTICFNEDGGFAVDAL